MPDDVTRRLSDFGDQVLYLSQGFRSPYTEFDGLGPPRQKVTVVRSLAG